jgi:uncharacterized iron-regulated membrane protein
MVQPHLHPVHADALRHRAAVDLSRGDRPAGTPKANLDQVVANAISNVPEKVPHFLVWDRHEPDALLASVGTSLEADPTNNRFVRLDAHTGAFLDAPNVTGRFTYIVLKLHTDMFTGLPGKLFLGLMGILFCVAIVSGVVVYSPSMRKLRFGTYRSPHSSRSLARFSPARTTTQSLCEGTPR